MKHTKKITTTQGRLCNSHCAPIIGQLSNQEILKKNQPNCSINFSIEKFIQSEKGTINSFGYFDAQTHLS